MTWFGTANNNNQAGEYWFDSTPGGSIIACIGTLTENVTINSVEIHCRRYNTGYNIRAAIYKGGVNNNDPDGATLVHDFGVITYAELPSADAWHSEPSSGSPTASNGDRLWVAIKGDYGIYLNVVNSADQGNADLDLLHSVGLGNDESVAYPASIGATGPSNISTTQAWKVAIQYTAGGGGAALMPRQSAILQAVARAANF